MGFGLRWLRGWPGRLPMPPRIRFSSLCPAPYPMGAPTLVRITSGESPLLQDAVFIYETAAARGERLTQRDLARTLRGRGHRFPNQNLRSIAVAIGLRHPGQQLPADGLRP